MTTPPIKLKQSPNSATAASAAQDARLLVRETMRISANLATSTAPIGEAAVVVDDARSSSFGLVEGQQFVESSLRLICAEEIDGRIWNYVAEKDGAGKFKRNSIRAVSLQSPQAPAELRVGLTHIGTVLFSSAIKFTRLELMSFIRSYVVPDGFPDSVTPSYVPYMKWRALKHFFGGAIGVFTTQTLLSSVGVSRNRATPGAVAINWIIKDGAGRIGKMIFARQGKKFDYDLKQLRFAGDLLMELGAGVELATAAVPHLFLPLACAANVAKNVAAVTSTSTRTPIYKAFAKGENIGDVTAKGECVGNIADLVCMKICFLWNRSCIRLWCIKLGTGLSIMISKRNPSLIATFALLSSGYVLSSYKEVKSVVLQTLNRARFSVAVDSFLKTGQVPSLREGNLQEDIFSFPWLKDRPVVLGSRFKDAFQDPCAYLSIEPLFEKERYVVTYNPSKDKVYALLKDQAKSDDILKAAFHAHVLLHFIQSANNSRSSSWKEQEHDHSKLMPTTANLEARIAESCKTVSSAYGLFKSKVAEQGWRMSDSLLNPGRARLVFPG
ncbi:hypothetical protein Patl1_36691 [Pistacia atlantica]|nr:hypothetical protein Patl1_36691 [Pistacia atlantica]